MIEIVGYDDLINELDSHIIKQAIITIFTTSTSTAKTETNQQPEKWDVKRTEKKKKNGKQLFFGTTNQQNKLFPTKLKTALAEQKEVVLILRSFTEEYDDETGLPIKELRGYIITTKNEITSNDNQENTTTTTKKRRSGKMKIHIQMISAYNLAQASNTDPQTGQPLKPEKAVIYCGPNQDYLDNNLKPINR